MHPQYNRLLINYIAQMLKGADNSIFGEGSCSHRFCYVEDLIEPLVNMMAIPKGFTESVNIGNPLKYTTLDLPEMIKSPTGSTTKHIFCSPPSDNPIQRKPNISLAHNAHNSQSKVTLKEGHNSALVHFSKLLEEN